MARLCEGVTATAVIVVYLGAFWCDGWARRCHEELLALTHSPCLLVVPCPPLPSPMSTAVPPLIVCEASRRYV